MYNSLTSNNNYKTNSYQKNNSSNQNSFQKKTPNQFVGSQQQIMKNISLYFFFPSICPSYTFLLWKPNYTQSQNKNKNWNKPHKWILSNFQIFVLIAFRKNNFLPVDYKTHTNSNSHAHYYCHLIPQKNSFYFASICFQILFALRLFVSIFCFTLLCSFLNYYYPFFCLRFFYYRQNKFLVYLPHIS